MSSLLQGQGQGQGPPQPPARILVPLSLDGARLKVCLDSLTSSISTIKEDISTAKTDIDGALGLVTAQLALQKEQVTMLQRTVAEQHTPESIMTLVQSALHQSSKDPSSANNELLEHFTAAFQQAQQDLGFKVTSSITTLTAGLNKTLNAIQQTQRELHTSVEDLELRVERKIDVIHKTQMDATNQILRRLDRLDNALEKQNSQINKVAQDKSESSSANEAILRGVLSKLNTLAEQRPTTNSPTAQQIQISRQKYLMADLCSGSTPTNLTSEVVGCQELSRPAVRPESFALPESSPTPDLQHQPRMGPKTSSYQLLSTSSDHSSCPQPIVGRGHPSVSTAVPRQPKRRISVSSDSFGETSSHYGIGMDTAEIENGEVLGELNSASPRFQDSETGSYLSQLGSEEEEEMDIEKLLKQNEDRRQLKKLRAGASGAGQ